MSCRHGGSLPRTSRVLRARCSMKLHALLSPVDTPKERMPRTRSACVDEVPGYSASPCLCGVCQEGNSRPTVLDPWTAGHADLALAV